MTNSPNTQQYMVTKNTKFEAKLARYLISKPGDQLLGYDACIEKVEKTINYRLIVLGLESIYLTDNPPNITQLAEPYVYYRDILRAELIDDYPDFLFGEERKNTSHMRLRVIKTSEKDKKRKKKKAKATSVDDMETIPSLFDRATLENIQTHLEPLSARRSASTRDLYQAPLPQLYAAIPLLLSTKTDSASANADSTQTDPLHLPLHQLDEPSVAFNTSLEFKERLDQLNLASDRSHFQRLFSARRAFSDEQNSLATARSKSARSSSSSKKKLLAEGDWSMGTARFNRYALQRYDDEQYGTLFTPRSRSRREDENDMNTMTARSTLTDISLTSTSPLATTVIDASTVYCPTLEEVRSLRDDIDEDMKDVDIYFLSLNSKIPEILSVALSNHIILATLRYNSDPQLSTLSTMTRLQQSMDQTRVKFDQLKSEILQSHTDTYHMIKLTDELSCACEKYSKVKDLFWKDLDLFVTYVAHFQCCTQAISNNQWNEDLINFAFSVMHLFQEVFLNTFVSADRLGRLMHDQCARFRLLTTCLLVSPITLMAFQTSSTDDSSNNETIRDTYRTVLKWMFMSTGLLWHVGDIISRPSWSSQATKKDFRLQDFVKLFEQHQNKDDYFDLFIDALTRLTINNENKDPLTPQHALYVYQFYSILSLLLINSNSLTVYIRDRYLEDFKYFLKEDAILPRIPIQYPVYRFIPDLIRSVNHRILFGEPNINISSRSKHRQLI